MTNRTFSTDRTTTGRQEAIARRAYEIWEQAGRPNGQDAEHWFQAETELTLLSVPTAREPARTEPPRARSPRRAEGSTSRMAVASR